MKKKLVLKKEIKEAIVNDLLELSLVGAFIGFCYVLCLVF